MKLRNVFVFLIFILLAACKSESRKDSDGPVFDSSLPEHESENVDVESSIHLYFDERLSDEIANTAVQLRRFGTNELIPVTIDIRGASLIIDPFEALETGQSYYIDSDYEISDVLGNTIEEPLYIEFTTIEQNIDPMVGTWECSQHLAVNNEFRFKDTVTFYSSGNIKDTERLVGAYYAYEWAREGEEVYFVTGTGHYYPEFTFSDENSFVYREDIFVTYCTRLIASSSSSS